MKLFDVVKEFCGDGDVCVWLNKFNLAAKLQGVEDIAKVLPLLLGGSAFAVYDQLSDEAKANGVKIEDALLHAFAMDRFSAYDAFRVRSLRQGEVVDVYLTELRQLSRLAKMENEDLLRNAFIAGLPPSVSGHLRAMVGVGSTPLAELAERARALVSQLDDRSVVASVASQPTVKEAIRCYKCGQAGHYARKCPRSAVNQSRRGTPKCWSCGEEGHMSRECTRHKMKGNEVVGPYAPAGSTEQYLAHGRRSG